MAKKALGKGLGSLMGTAEAETAALEPDSTLKISQIVPNKDQPRKLFKQSFLSCLTRLNRMVSFSLFLLERRALSTRSLLVSADTKLLSSRALKKYQSSSKTFLMQRFLSSL